MYTVYSNELYHHGIKGQKWGVRRYQNEDGTLTAAGKKRYTESWSRKYDRKSRSAAKSAAKWNKRAENAETDEKRAKYQKIADKKQQKSERFAGYAKNYQDIHDQTGIVNKLLFNDATRKTAAKYMTNNNMPMKDALKKAERKAVVNTAVHYALKYAGPIAITAALTAAKTAADKRKNAPLRLEEGGFIDAVGKTVR